MVEYCDKCGWIKQQCQCEEPMTNADKIRSMTDEELAEFIAYGISWREICNECNCKEYCDDETDCKHGVLKWLKNKIN